MRKQLFPTGSESTANKKLKLPLPSCLALVFAQNIISLILINFLFVKTKQNLKLLITT